jgi:hypothetical protein
LQRVDTLSRELEVLRRDLLRALAGASGAPVRKRTLFGTVSAGDITGEMMDNARRDLLRSLDNL